LSTVSGLSSSVFNTLSDSNALSGRVFLVCSRDIRSIYMRRAANI
jgi:hypothetical protein